MLGGEVERFAVANPTGLLDFGNSKKGVLLLDHHSLAHSSVKKSLERCAFRLFVFFQAINKKTKKKKRRKKKKKSEDNTLLLIMIIQLYVKEYH